MEICLESALHNITRSKRHYNYILPIMAPKCYKVMNLPSEERCKFTMETKSCGSNMYNDFLFCKIGPKNNWEMAAAMTLLFLFTVFIFMVVAKASESYFCPALKAVAKFLHLNEQVAGVTLLALGDGSADLVALYKQQHESIGFLYTSLVGGCFFVTTFVAGLIIVICPIKLSTSAFLRDSFFLLFSLLLVDFVIGSGEVTIYKSIAIIVVYIMYILVIVIEQILMHYTQKKLRKQMRVTLERPTIDILSVIILRRSLYPLDRDLQVKYSSKNPDEDLKKAHYSAVSMRKEHEGDDLNETSTTDEAVKDYEDLEEILVNRDKNSANIGEEYVAEEVADHIIKDRKETIDNDNLEEIHSDETVTLGTELIEKNGAEALMYPTHLEDEKSDSLYDPGLDIYSSEIFKSCEDYQDHEGQCLKLESKLDQRESHVETEVDVTMTESASEKEFTDLKPEESFSADDLPSSKNSSKVFSQFEPPEDEQIPDPSAYEEDEHLRTRTRKKRSRFFFNRESGYEIRNQVLCALWIQFIISVVGVDWNEFKRSNWFRKTYTIITIPINIVLAFLIPLVDLEAPMNGWSKILNCIHFITLPALIISFFDNKHETEVLGVNLLLLCLPWGALMGLLVYFTAKPDEAPKYHKVFFLFALVGSILVICCAVEQIMLIIEVISYVTALSLPFLESTFVSIGYSIGYLVVNVQLAREGYAKMAFASCSGGPITLLTAGFGTYLLAECGFQERTYGYKWVASSEGSLGKNCTLFMGCGLFGVIVAMVVTNFVGRKSIGAFLIITYLLGFLTLCLSESHVIHPFGTDHGMDLD